MPITFLIITKTRLSSTYPSIPRCKWTPRIAKQGVRLYILVVLCFLYFPRGNVKPRARWQKSLSVKHTIKHSFLLFTFTVFLANRDIASFPVHHLAFACNDLSMTHLLLLFLQGWRRSSISREPAAPGNSQEYKAETASKKISLGWRKNRR
jgi:hypothetical protein